MNGYAPITSQLGVLHDTSFEATAEHRSNVER